MAASFPWVVRIMCVGIVISLVTCPVLGQDRGAIRTNDGQVWEKSVSEPPAAVPAEFQLEALQQRTFHYFWDLADPDTGLIPDRYPSQRFCSIAAQGMGYTCYVIGVEKGWVERDAAAVRVRDSLRFLVDAPQGEAVDATGHQGFFYHFLDMDTGQRYGRCELSSIDTTLLLAGVAVCETYFEGEDPVENEIRRLAGELIQRVNWQWMVAESGHVCMGWKPESGFLSAEWKGYDESVLLHVLAAGSERFPIQPETYQKYTSSYVWETFQGQTHINFGPLFGHQYSQMFIDFRGLRDAVCRQHDLDYFENARRATLSQVAYAVENPRDYVGYGRDEWGLTACDGPGWGKVRYQGQEVQVHNYSARGIASNYDNDDATIAPTAAGGSYPYTPDLSHRALKRFWEMNDGKLIGEYGFFDSYNRTFVAQGRINREADPNQIWINGDYIGIDQGPILIQTSNHQTGLIWKLLQRHPDIQRGLERLDFQPVP